MGGKATGRSEQGVIPRQCGGLEPRHYSSPENRSHAECRVIPKGGPIAAPLAPDFSRLSNVAREIVVGPGTDGAHPRETGKYPVKVTVFFPRGANSGIRRNAEYSPF